MNNSASSSKNRVFIAELLELPPIKIGDFSFNKDSTNDKRKTPVGFVSSSIFQEELRYKLIIAAWYLEFILQSI